MILRVCLEVSLEVIDPCCEECYLYFCITCVCFVSTELYNDFLLWEEDWRGSGVTYNNSDRACSNVGAMYKGNISIAAGTTATKTAFILPDIDNYWLSFNARGDSLDPAQTGSFDVILTIDGVKKLHGTEYRIGPDYMEIGSFIGLAAATKGSITITGVEPRDLRPIKLAFKKLGIHWEIEGDTLTVPMGQSMQVDTDLGGMTPKIDDSPWPGFPADLTSVMTVVATQVSGTVLIFEKMFESRMFFVDKLIGMGARITLCDPHRAVVSGPCMLHGDELVSPDVRAGMALVIAALSAQGESVIRNVYQIERGYEHLVERLQSLGAHITRVDA